MHNCALQCSINGSSRAPCKPQEQQRTPAVLLSKVCRLLNMDMLRMRAAAERKLAAVLPAQHMRLC
jgi:hypothetical protein